ncbi:diaminopimelate decarboxylase [Candidatus Bathyarchaeota archaeon]|nr:diaminopimelate decarboxylase [Candidatus Bathyarchaeota archaeon]
MNPLQLNYLENKNGTLYIDGVSTLELTEKFKTPLYVLSQSRIEENFRRLNSALKKHYNKIRIYYSAKANSNISVLKILLKEGAWLDAVSPGEIFLGLKAGFPADKILFTGTSVSEEEVKYAVEVGATINIDSLSQLKKLLKITVPEVLSVRVNPGIGFGHHNYCITGGEESKFGLWQNEAEKAYKEAEKAGVKKFGIHMHIGSGILNINVFTQAAEVFLNIVKEIKENCGLTFDFINFGGGLGVPYKPEETELSIEKYAESIISIFKRKIKDLNSEPFFAIEPGRYIVCDAGILLTKAVSIKVTPTKKFIGVDAGLNVLIRPAMYNAYHHILVANKLNEEKLEEYDVVGPICESADFLAKKRIMPKVDEGDVLAVLNTGAYGFSMSSQYNARPRPAEVLVNKGRFELIRERENFNTLLIGQRIATWLKQNFGKCMD